MMNLNTFSLYDLLGLATSAGLAVAFLVRYWRSGRRTLDLTLGGTIATAAGGCLLIFLQDNIIPEGRSAWSVPAAAEQTAFLIRLLYVAGAAGMALQLHFTLRFCRSRSWPGRHILVIYLLAGLLVPMIWSRQFVETAARPVGETSDWMHALPWMPHIGPLAVVFLAAWAATQVCVQVLLWDLQRRGGWVRDRQVQIGLVRLAMIAQAGGVAIDVTNSVLGFAGISAVPASSTLMALFLGLAMLRELRISGTRSESPRRSLAC